MQLVQPGCYTPAAQSVADFGVPRSIRAIVWHDMEGYLPAALATWNSSKQASAHLAILRDGTVVLTCRLADVAWHAGTNAAIGRTPFWRSTNINPYSVGIELEGFYTVPYTEAQIQACIRVARWLTAAYGIVPKHTLNAINGHHLHSELSTQRLDPGPLFPLDRILKAITGG